MLFNIGHFFVAKRRRDITGVRATAGGEERVRAPPFPLRGASPFWFAVFFWLTARCLLRPVHLHTGCYCIVFELLIEIHKKVSAFLLRRKSQSVSLSRISPGLTASRRPWKSNDGLLDCPGKTWPPSAASLSSRLSSMLSTTWPSRPDTLSLIPSHQRSPRNPIKTSLKGSFE